MDRQAWVAIILCLIGLAAWQVYVVKHMPPAPVKALASPSPLASAGRDSVEPGPTAASSQTAASPGSTASRPTPAVPPSEATPTPAPFVEKTATLRNADLELLLSNRGRGIA